jgi:hypothetical protein
MAEPDAPSPREIAMIPTNIRFPFIFPSSFGKFLLVISFGRMGWEMVYKGRQKNSVADRYRTK